MSFSGTPLGQDRRVDHQTFFNKNSYKGTSLTYVNQPPPQRLQSINQQVPSYAYGAPTLAARSTNASPPRASRSQAGDDDAQRESRYRSLKQRNEALQSRPGSSLGQQIINRAPQPTPAPLIDTSVNVANAFQQEALAYSAMGPTSTNSWSNKAIVPRSTSVEYEQQTQTATQRRMPIPQRRIGSKPASKTGSLNRVPEVENDTSVESVDANGRGKSPFNSLVDIGNRAATFVMRQRSQEPEARPTEESRSYDYAAEEQELEQLQKNANQSLSTTSRRAKMSDDNKAYRPTVSDEEAESEEVSDDERRGRGKKKKKVQTGPGALTNMPSLTYDKRKKRKSRKNGEDENGIEEQEEDYVSEQRSRRSTTPSLLPVNGGPNHSSTSDTSRSLNFSGMNSSTLEPIPESPEKSEQSTNLNIQKTANLTRKQRARSRSRSRVRPESRSGIGSTLGRAVHGLYVLALKLVSIILLFIASSLGGLVNFLFFKPTGKFLITAAIAYGAWAVLKSQDISLMPSWSSSPYAPPTLPPENADELITRLLKMESLVAGLQSDVLTDRDRLDHGSRRMQDIINRLESRVESEADRVRKSEEQSRSASSKSFEAFQRELNALRQLQSEQASHQSDGPVSDEEAREKLRKLEERLGSMESSVKEAIELGQTAAKAGSAVAAGAGASTGSHWWNKLGSSSSSGLTIKTSDGSDVTPIIGSLVEQALMHYTADGIARADYALNSGGASVIPSLTSQTLEMRQTYFFGLIEGSSIYARSPVHALHHETSLGYCWPFKGSQGHLGVVLTAPVRITDFTIDHVARAVSLDSRPAPRHMEVWGLIEGKDNLSKYEAFKAKLQARRNAGEDVPEDPVRPSILPKNAEYARIASFMYDVHSPQHIQTFSVPEELKESGLDFGIVVLFVNSNWGSPDYTCLYRFRVHGERADAIPAPDPQ